MFACRVELRIVCDMSILGLARVCLEHAGGMGCGNLHSTSCALGSDLVHRRRRMGRKPLSCVLFTVLLFQLLWLVVTRFVGN